MTRPAYRSESRRLIEKQRLTAVVSPAFEHARQAGACLSGPRNRQHRRTAARRPRSRMRSKHAKNASDVI